VPRHLEQGRGNGRDPAELPGVYRAVLVDGAGATWRPFMVEFTATKVPSANGSSSAGAGRFSDIRAGSATPLPAPFAGNPFTI
jgi:hypothetical protein